MGVKVIVDFTRKIKEPEVGERNNEKVAKLTPQCPSVTMAEVKMKTLVRERGKADIPLQKTPWQIVTPTHKAGG